MKPGTQVIYVPLHADGDINHPDAERGFVTSTKDNVAFCRFFANRPPYQLRTKANSESVSLRHLIVEDHGDQELIDHLLIDILDAIHP